MRKLALFLVVVITVLSLAACGKGDGTGSADLGANLPPVEYVPRTDYISSGKYNEFYYVEYTDYIEITDCSIPEGQASIEFPKVILSKPVKVISVDSLQGNVYLKSAVIPSTVTEIGNYLFANCSKLESITLPDRVEKIGCAAFFGTPWFDTLQDEYVIVGEGVLIKYNGNGGDITIPEDVKYLSDAFAENSRILSITIPTSVEGISDYAFYECSSVTNVAIPTHISEIGSHAFDGTTWLLSEEAEFVTVGNSVLIAYNGSDTDVTVPDGIKYIAGAFGGNKSITSITVPASVRCVRSGEFHDCSSLKTATFLGDDTFIEQAAFANCTSLNKVILPAKLKILSTQTFYSCGKLTDVTLPKSLIYIGNAAFYSNGELTEITLPPSLKGVGSAAFFGCVKLTSLNFPDTLECIGQVAVACCYELSEFTLPPKITAVPTGLFSYCVKLKELRFGDHVTDIGEGAFEGCSKLSVYIEGKETTLQKDIFLSCEGKEYKIYCKKGSVAESYAKKNKIKYSIIKE